MATIDKPLPNTKTTVEVPGEVEVAEEIKEKVEEVETKGGPVEIEMTEEGGAEVSFDPKVCFESDITLAIIFRWSVNLTPFSLHFSSILLIFII